MCTHPARCRCRTPHGGNPRRLAFLEGVRGNSLTLLKAAACHPIGGSPRVPYCCPSAAQFVRGGQAHQRRPPHESLLQPPRGSSSRVPGIHPNSPPAARRARPRDQKASAREALNAPYALGSTLHPLMLGIRTVLDSHRRLARIPVGGPPSQMTPSRWPSRRRRDTTRTRVGWSNRTL